MLDKETGLTDKQKRFCDEYLIDLNATQAAIRAGYSKKTAEIIGFENLRKPKIQAYIASKQQSLQEKTEVTQEYVVNGLKKIAVRCTKEETFDPAGANRAFELLGRTLGIFVDKLNVNQDIEIKVTSFSQKTLEEALKDAKVS